MKNFLFALLAFVGLSFSAMSASAGVAEVKRVSTLVDGVFVPALLISVDGQNTTVPLGSAGLTRHIVFNAKESVLFAEAYTGVPMTSVTNRSGRVEDPITGVLLVEPDNSW